ncbi:hypothetical protein HII31_10625 [Pseudocercospora fuligena]|uniref:Uncharacterized protein n=1 Tax=Pseudocercospora fuligena TaxID=685502 RepID=A0A8H6VD95_9PEZI|nr:hypothetical protein HII31_10625 [Pseudocercospora fuligena]
MAGDRNLRDEPRVLQKVPETVTVKVSNVERTLSCKSLSDDPSIRPIGSEPTIFNSKIVRPQPKSHSQTSQRPPGVREIALGRRKQHMSDSDSPMFSYASSEYSTTTPSDSGPMLTSRPRKDPASYERLVADVARSQAHQDRGPQVAKKSQQDGLGVLSSESVETAVKPEMRSRGTRTLKPNMNPYRDQTISAVDPNRRHRCKSCESALFEGGLSLSRKDAIPHASQARLTKKPTLPTLPPHLVPSTSSSSRSSELQVRYRSSGPTPRGPEALANAFHDAARAVTRPQAAVATPVDPLRLSSPSQQGLPSDDSMSHTPPQLYQPSSVESIVKDFAYTPQSLTRKRSQQSLDRELYGAAASFYHDHGQSVAAQPGVRHSIAYAQKDLPALPPTAHRRRRSLRDKHERVHHSHGLRLGRYNGISGSSAGSKRPDRPLRRKRAAETGALRAFDPRPGVRTHKVHEHVEHGNPFRHHRQYSKLLEPPYYRDDDGLDQKDSDARYQ